MRRTLKGRFISKFIMWQNYTPNPSWDSSLIFSRSPLKPAELQVLRSQYEKEGDYVGVQTKFNYAWVCLLPFYFRWDWILFRFWPLTRSFGNTPFNLHCLGSDKIELPCRATRRCQTAFWNIPNRSRTTTRMPILFGSGKLQAGKLWRG